ncbi:MAG: hypothetical protein EXQ49_09140 [Acidobacteria bacterium]|nr:hypothetical protein [Acidobacteriota bacterium]
MGEVYRARDTKLNRDVAIKVLPDAFADDAERLTRFTREAQTLAALNHPNIAAIYGLEESPGSTVQGPTDARSSWNWWRARICRRRSAPLRPRAPYEIPECRLPRPFPSRGRSSTRSRPRTTSVSCIGI